MRKILSLLLVATIFIGMTSLTSEAKALPLRVVIDSTELIFPDAQPFIDENYRIQTPTRFIGEALGATVTWDQEKLQAKFVKGTIVLYINIGTSSYQLNGREMKMDTKAIIKNNRTYVPVRYVAEALGASVTWNSSIQIVYLKAGQSTGITTETGVVTYYDGVGFNPVKDLDKYGVLTIAKSAEFSMNMAKSVSFYKKGNEYRIKGNVPKLPKGYQWEIMLQVQHKTIRNDYAYDTLQMDEKMVIPSSGNFDFKAQGQDISDVKWVQCYIQIFDSKRYSIGTMLIKSNAITGENTIFFNPNDGNAYVRFENVFDFDVFNQWY